MAGLSSRFTKAGYTVPKYALSIGQKTVFELTISSFINYFDCEKFLFITIADQATKEFVFKYAKKLGIKDFQIIELKNTTRGQAETAYIGLNKYTEDFDITIFNIDTIRHNYVKPVKINEWDGYLEVFEDAGTHWSFVEPGEDSSVLRTTEKIKISDLCSSGLYYFKSHKYFKDAFESALLNEESNFGEFYVAPLYNKLIRDGMIIKYHKINSTEIDFCGTPDEYINLVKKMA